METKQIINQDLYDELRAEAKAHADEVRNEIAQLHHSQQLDTLFNLYQLKHQELLFERISIMETSSMYKKQLLRSEGRLKEVENERDQFKNQLINHTK
jgi:hypothetical protein